MRERGFSMIELLVAMVITMIIMGAVYGLIAGGQNAFRREPEMAERQQNIRMAMDLIMRDVANTASGLPTFVQAFTPNLDACAACPMGPDGVQTDELEMITNSESRDTEPLCRDLGTPNDLNPQLMRDLTIGANPLQPNTIVIPFTATGEWTLRNLTGVAQDNTGGQANCNNLGNHTDLTLDLSQPDPTGLNTAVSPCVPNGWGNTVNPCELVGLSFANLVRYRIRLEPVTNVPMLERWSSDAPGAIVGGLPQGFQTLARGIENLQVQYLLVGGDPNNPADWFDNAPVVVSPNYPTLITQVRVLLAARSEAQNIAGATTSASGPDAIRGSLMSSASPRATLMNISLDPGGVPLWR